MKRHQYGISLLVPQALFRGETSDGVAKSLLFCQGTIDLFTDTAAIEFIRFKEYYGMPRGHLLSIYARFSGKKRTSMYISREKGDHYYIQTRHNDLFSHYNLFQGKLKEKLAQKARVNTDASISDRGHVPWAC